MNETKVINPYRVALRLLLRRISWDLSSISWRSRAALRSIKDTHVGEKAVILCNGPSLNSVQFDELANVFTFGLNKIHLLFDKSNFRPSAIVSINPHVIEQTADFYNSTDIPLFLDFKATKYVRPRKEVTFLHSGGVRGFASDCSISIDQGYTVTYVAMQLAAHMGFRDIALVGCDHNFATKGPENATVEAGDTDPNHFDPKYFSGGVAWQLPDIVQSEISYLYAEQSYRNLGGRIVNCTNGGKLEIFPRMTLNKFLAS